MQDLLSRNTTRLDISMRLMDVFALWVAGHLAGWVRFSESLTDQPPVHTVLLYFCCALVFLVFSQFELYASWRGRSQGSLFARVAASWAFVVLTGLFFSFLIHHVGELSRLWLFYWFVIGMLFLLITRGVLYSFLNYLRAKGLNSKRVVIVGYGHTGQEMHKRAMQQNWFGYEVRAVHADHENAAHIKDPRIDRIETLKDIHAYVVNNDIHEVWITLPMSESAQLLDLQYLLRNALVDIRWVPDMLSMQLLSNKMVDFLGLPGLELNHPMSNGVRGIVKDVFDKVFSLVVLVLLIPLFAVIAIAIKYSSPGPVFFKQSRLGLNGRKFNVYKFRSMKVHQELNTITQAKAHDPRVTRVGQFLRSTSLDELPQFINVLIGDMSVVGPRPHALQHNEMYRDVLEMYMLRHRAKPGITGWAQIHGYRGETDTVDKMAMRVQFDLEYIQNWTLQMDLRIIIWTAFKGWTGNNAY